MKDRTEHAVQTLSLTKTFIKGKTKNCAVKDVNLKVEKGTIASILGPTGCGKSVLLKIIGGIIPPTSGEIHLNGVPYKDGIPKEELHRVGFVFQKDNLLAWRTVEKNLLLPLEIMKLKSEDMNERVLQMLDLVGLREYNKALPHELSGGMKQRVALVRALMHNPDIVLMDQPFGALDEITRRMLTYEFINIWKKTQKTFLIVTNSIDEALLLSKKIFVMGRSPGTIVFDLDVNIPYDMRTQEITIDDYFLDLKAELRKWTTGDAIKEQSIDMIKEQSI